MGCEDEVAVAVAVEFFGRPWRLGAVLMNSSPTECVGRGGGGARSVDWMMLSKCVERV